MAILQIIQLFITMGNSSTQTKNISQNWEIIERTSQGYCIVRDRSGRQGQLYEQVIMGQTDIWKQLKIYNIRSITPHQIVAVYCSQLQDSFGLCSSSHCMKIITEHLCVRFNKSFELSIAEILFVMAQAVKGFHFLYQKAGFFHITRKMIGLTTEGEVKVWMHQFFGQNSPQYIRNSITTIKIDKYESINQQQVSMIGQIVAIIAQHTNKLMADRQLNVNELKRYNFRNISQLFKSIRERYQMEPLKRVSRESLRKILPAYNHH